MTVSGIDVTNPAPRVNFELMNQYIGKRVTLVGKVENGAVENGVLKVKTSDEGMVDVIVTGIVPQDMFVEIDGIVESTNTIRQESIVGFGNSFDMGNYNEVCKLINGPTYKNIFLPA